MEQLLSMFGGGGGGGGGGGSAGGHSPSSASSSTSGNNFGGLADANGLTTTGAIVLGSIALISFLVLVVIARR